MRSGWVMRNGWTKHKRIYRRILASFSWLFYKQKSLATLTISIVNREVLNELTLIEWSQRFMHYSTAPNKEASKFLRQLSKATAIMYFHNLIMRFVKINRTERRLAQQQCLHLQWACISVRISPFVQSQIKPHVEMLKCQNWAYVYMIIQLNGVIENWVESITIVFDENILPGKWSLVSAKKMR